MRVLLVHNFYREPGGEDVVFASEKALLTSYGHEVTEYTDNNQRILGMHPLECAVQTLWSMKTRENLEHLLGEHSFDIAHFHNTFPLISPSAYSACHQAGVPVIQTLHNYRLLCPGAILYRSDTVCERCLGKAIPWPAVRHACYRGSRMQTAVVGAKLALHHHLKTWQKQVDVYIALNAFGRHKFIQGGIPAEKIISKPNFVQPDPGERKGQGDFALYVGRLSPEKGIRTLLRAWRELKGVPLKIVGTGPLLTECRDRVREENLHFVEILGGQSRDDVFSFMKGASFLIFPSRWYEPFGMTIIEAFACGIPIIASRMGGIAEMVETGHTGLHFSPGDARDLAYRVAWAWSHPRELWKMGKEARREYEKKYTAEQNYRELMDIYDLALQRTRKRH
jgi:glycosyltransferase involved in cell wall biosynthesis